MDIQEMEIERRRGREFAEELAQRDRAEQVQWQYNRIQGCRYNAHYTEIRDDQRANYLDGNYRGRDQSMNVCMCACAYAMYDIRIKYI